MTDRSPDMSDLRRVTAGMIDDLRSSGAVPGIEIGERAPSFELPSAVGTTVALDDRLALGPVAVVFYRGAWCPYCDLHLRSLQESLGDIADRGASLLAISPQAPDASVGFAERLSLGFDVLSDLDQAVSESWWLQFELPAAMVIVDRAWNLLQANAPALWLCTGVDTELLSPPANVVRLSVDPAGLRPRIANFEEYAHHLGQRVRAAAVIGRDPDTEALATEVEAIAGGAAHRTTAEPAFAITMRIEVEGHELALFSTIATFGTAVDVGLSELSIETFYPADDATAAVLAARPWIR